MVYSLSRKARNQCLLGLQRLSNNNTGGCPNGKEPVDAPFDLVASKGDELYRISVKSSMTYRKKPTDSWEIELRRKRTNANGTSTYQFNQSESDIVAIYIHEIDKVCFIPSRLITVASVISVREEATKYANKPSWIISDFAEVQY